MSEPLEGTTERYIQIDILEVMKDGKIWNNADIKNRISNLLPITQEDRLMNKKGEPVRIYSVNNASA